MSSRLSVLFDKDIDERVFCLQGLNDHHNYSFMFSADKPVIQRGEVSKVTATLLDDGVPLAGEEISFLLNGVTTTAVTDEFGEASISYTGSGVGQVPIQASYRTFLQETFVLWDTLFYDNAVSTDYNPNWENYNNNLTVARDNLGTLLTNTSGNNGYLMATRTPPSSFTVEFDVIAIEHSVSVAYYSQTTDRIRIDTRATAGDTVKIEHNDGENKVYVNEELVFTNTTSNKQYISFRLENNASFKYKNFKLYSI